MILIKFSFSTFLRLAFNDNDFFTPRKWHQKRPQDIQEKRAGHLKGKRLFLSFLFNLFVFSL